MSHECEKKAPSAPAHQRDGKGYTLETFHDRLRDLCADNFSSHGRHRPCLTQDQAQQAVALARQAGLLREASIGWAEFKATNTDLHYGSEHVVESDEAGEQMAKITIPPAFGLVPRVLEHPVIQLQGAKNLPLIRQAIEFVPATPLEYLERWLAANDVFEDDVRLTSVVQWADGHVSFGISQPQYHGEPAPARDIDRFFGASGWTRISDPGDSGHVLYFNYAFEVLAIDALPRNCYIQGDALLPFDVILCRPDEKFERYLRLYPE